jgi:hypothetical protein
VCLDGRLGDEKVNGFIGGLSASVFALFVLPVPGRVPRAYRVTAS